MEATYVSESEARLRAELEEKFEARDFERLTRAHDDAGREFRSMGVKPACAFDLSLEHRAVERMLVVARPERSREFPFTLDLRARS